MEPSTQWGTLGAPGPAHCAELLYVVETPSATLRRAAYEHGAVVAYHKHAGASLVYGVGGPCVERQGTGSIIKRRFVYHPPGYAHSLEFQGATHILAFDVNDRAFGQHLQILRESSLALPATLYDQVWRVLLAVGDTAPIEIVEALVRQLLDMVLEHAARSPPRWLTEVIDGLHSDWREVPSARTIAERHSFSTPYLCRTFKRFTGVTLQRYALALRCDYARGLLWGSGIPIAEVAAETGFADQSHLTRALTAHSQKSPGSLRLRAPSLSGARRLSRA